MYVAEPLPYDALIRHINQLISANPRYTFGR
jgi:hypothetical protein